MLIPRRRQDQGFANEADFVTILNNVGLIQFSQLELLIPVGTQNTWVPTGRITFGFRFDWLEGGIRWHVHGHEPDPDAPEAGNAFNGWIIRVKRNNKYLLEHQNIPPQGDPSYWTNNLRAFANNTHIKVTSNTLVSGRRNSV